MIYYDWLLNIKRTQKFIEMQNIITSKIVEVITQTEGEIEINGKVSALLELGAGFNPEYTGMQNIYLNTYTFFKSFTLIAFM